MKVQNGSLKFKMVQNFSKMFQIVYGSWRYKIVHESSMVQKGLK